MEKWVCGRCGEEIYSKPYKNQICGKDLCQGRFKHYRECKCGTWFIHSSKKIYCSSKCRDLDISRKAVKCGFCGKLTYRLECNSRSRKMYFCNIQCMRDYEATLKEKRICKYCGSEFLVYKSALAKTNATGDYCSRECCDKAKEIPGSNGYRADFEKVKKEHFSGLQFCAFCGTHNSIHIHHIIPFRLTEDNSESNLIPLCIRCHPRFERISRGFIESMDGEYDMAKDMLNSILRPRQEATLRRIRKIVEGR